MATHPAKSNLSIPVSKARYAYIRARAARINLGAAPYMQILIDRWFSEGCPNLHALESQLPALPIPKESVS